MDVAEMESHIHCIEKEAYSNVLRAFIAQSDVLSWGKEELISELRKELRVSDVEHRELLAKVNSDDSVKMIRDWRKGTVRDKEMLPPVPNSMVHNTHKRPKTSHTPVPISQSYLQSTQHTPAVIPSSAAMNFRDGQRSGEVAMFTSKDNADQSMKSVYDSRQTSIVGKGARQPMVLSNMANQPPDLKNFEKESNIIKIRATDQLIREVERVISGEAQINQQEVAKAKLLLKEHEQAILEALDKLANVLDDDDTPGHSQHWHTYEGQQQRNGHQLGMHQPYLGRSISFAG